MKLADNNLRASVAADALTDQQHSVAPSSSMPCAATTPFTTQCPRLCIIVVRVPSKPQHAPPQLNVNCHLPPLHSRVGAHVKHTMRATQRKEACCHRCTSSASTRYVRELAAKRNFVPTRTSFCELAFTQAPSTLVP